MKNIYVHSLYWNNISTKILSAQKNVYNHLGINLVQENCDGLSHGIWINNVIRNADNDDILVFSDIDAFPLNRKAFDTAVKYAELGQIFGLAQTANHTSNSNNIYAGPMFICFKKSTWVKCGKPSFEPDMYNDCGQVFTNQAINNNIYVNLLLPTACIKTLWPLSSNGVFGIGTFYQNDFFHLFESRKDNHIKLIEAVAEDIISNKSLSFDKYINIINQDPGNNTHFQSKKNVFIRLINFLKLKY